MRYKYTKVTLLVGVPEDEIFACGCDQTMTVAHLHLPEKEQYVIAHDRGFLSQEDMQKTNKVFDEHGGI